MRASIQLWDVNGVASVYNPRDRSVSVIAELEVQGFLMHDLPERFDLAEQFDRAVTSTLCGDKPVVSTSIAANAGRPTGDPISSICATAIITAYSLERSDRTSATLRTDAS